MVDTNSLIDTNSLVDANAISGFVPQTNFPIFNDVLGGIVNVIGGISATEAAIIVILIGTFFYIGRGETAIKWIRILILFLLVLIILGVIPL